MFRKLRANSTGFTIFELLVTIAVMTITLAIAVPSFMSWLPTLRLSSAARQVATDLQVARMKAISRNTSYTVNFNTSTGGYTFAPGTGTDPDSRDIDDLYPGISISSVSKNPVFTARGTANEAVTITLSNGSVTKLVCVKTVGRVNIADASCT